MSSLVMVLAGGLLTAILPCHGRSAGICRREGKGAIEEGRFGKRPKGKAASSRRTPKGPSQKTAPTSVLHSVALVFAIWSIDRKSAGMSAYATKLPMSRHLGCDLLRGRLGLEVEEQNAVADACGVVGLGNLERHEAAVRGDHWIGSFAACIVVEIRKASEVLSGSVEF